MGSPGSGWLARIELTGGHSGVVAGGPWVMGGPGGPGGPGGSEACTSV